jgi:ABC-type glutathione transport system ATPase component
VAVLVIAHRLVTIERADTVVYMEAGRIVERGTHAELMKAPRGHYCQLVATGLAAPKKEDNEKNNGATGSPPTITVAAPTPPTSSSTAQLPVVSPVHPPDREGVQLLEVKIHAQPIEDEPKVTIIGTSGNGANPYTLVSLPVNTAGAAIPLPMTPHI